MRQLLKANKTWIDLLARDQARRASGRSRRDQQAEDEGKRHAGATVKHLAHQNPPGLVDATVLLARRRYEWRLLPLRLPRQRRSARVQ